MTAGSGIFRSAVKRLDSTGAVHQRAVSATRNSNADIRQIRRVARVLVQIRSHIEIADLDMTEEILHRSQGLAATSVEPGGLIGRKVGGAAHRRPRSRAADVGRGISIGGIGKRTAGDFKGEVISIEAIGRSSNGAWQSISKSRAEA